MSPSPKTQAWRAYVEATGKRMLTQGEYEAFDHGWQGNAYQDPESAYPDVQPTEKDRAWTAGRRARERAEKEPNG